LSSYILVIDQGTTSTRVVLYSLLPQVRLIAKASREFPQHFPQASWVEHDLNEIWLSFQQAAEEALQLAKQQVATFKPEQIAAIGITNQRETLGVFDRHTSEPLARAIVWQCKRSSAICQRFTAGEKAEITAKTGLPVDPYFSASKITWLLENSPGVAAALRQGSALVGTIDSYLIHRLSRGAEHVTEASNASRTLLYHIEHGVWDEDLLRRFSLPSVDILPRVQDSAGVFARTRGLGFLPDGIPISGVLGDQQAALAGQGCFQPGEAKCTYGTGAFLLCQLGERPLRSASGLLTTVSWSLGGKRSFALEGSTYIAGAAVQFIRDQLGLLAHSSDASNLSGNLQAAPDIYFVPALSGLGAPWWEPAVKGALFGLTRATTKEQVILATLEGIAFQICDVLGAMAKDLEKPLAILRVDGGASSNDRLLALQADFAALTVERPRNIESSSLGAAIFAGLGCKMLTKLEDATKFREVEASFSQDSDEKSAQLRAQKLAGWQRAIASLRMFHS
jgi:glycerol kinase